MNEEELKKLSDEELLSLAMKLKANNDIAEQIADSNKNEVPILLRVTGVSIH